MSKTRRFEFAATKSLDLVLGVNEIKNDNAEYLKTQVIVIGSGTGAHVAALLCRYVRERTTYQIRFLLGMF